MSFKKASFLLLLALFSKEAIAEAAPPSAPDCEQKTHDLYNKLDAINKIDVFKNPNIYSRSAMLDEPLKRTIPLRIDVVCVPLFISVFTVNGNMMPSGPVYSIYFKNDDQGYQFGFTLDPKNGEISYVYKMWTGSL